MGVIVGGCSYWIGFHPLKWSEARKSCESMNASLVVLDSPKTISHMMSLMLDNRAGSVSIWPQNFVQKWSSSLILSKKSVSRWRLDEKKYIYISASFLDRNESEIYLFFFFFQNYVTFGPMLVERKVGNGVGNSMDNSFLPSEKVSCPGAQTTQIVIPTSFIA